VLPHGREDYLLRGRVAEFGSLGTPHEFNANKRVIFMGATTWDYFTPYEDDAGAALQRLREQVFREGRYERFTLSQEELEPFQISRA